MSGLLQTIKDQVSKEHGLYKWHDNIASHLWPEVCKRYAFEVAKASLKEITSKEFFEWFNNQRYQREQGEQEYTLVYEIDLPKILNDFLKHRSEKML